MFRSVGRDNRILMLSLWLWALGEGLWINQRSIYIEQLGATPSQIGLVLSVEGFARALFLLPGGWLSDRYGPRKVIIVSWLAGILGTAILAGAPSWQWMIPGEFIFGGSAFVIPALVSYSLMAMPSGGDDEGSEGKIITIFAAFSAGLIISQPLGGLIADIHSIRTTYWISIFFMAVSAAVAFRLPEYMPPDERSEGRWHTLLQNRSFVALIGFVFIAILGVTLGYPLAPLFLHEVRGFSLRLIGIFAALFSVGTVTWNLLLARLRPRWGMTAAQALVWVSMLLLWSTRAVPSVGVGYMMLGAMFTARTLMNAAAARRVSPARRGMASGFTELSMSSALAIAPRIAGMLYEIRPELPFIASAVSIPPVAILGILLLSVLLKPSPKVAPLAEAPSALHKL